MTLSTSGFKPNRKPLPCARQRWPLPRVPKAVRHSGQLATSAAASSPGSFGLKLDQQLQADHFLDYLLQENKKYNLTAVRNREDATERHLLDSLALLNPIEEHTAAGGSVRLLDVGSGPGLPGCILAIARPHWKVTCLDATQKRIAFVRAAALETGISNVIGTAGRCEDLGHEVSLRGAFDVVTARAVAPLDTLVELCMPFACVGGILVAAKGADIEDEVARAKGAIGKLGGHLVGIMPVQSFSDLGQRNAVVVQKVATSPEAYPRKNGLPKRKPL